ncbi:MAG: 16S rRNA (adenine(1518)-N(6)/adenine(1519)-N(6))-dimethyltransferase RsmA [Desulfobacteraceae bacterium]|nr:16S rRNA (adenine(1518)-N(6)/adenine(1519)-N(6))-dimethyltransferase RsmA [Desulfobacteraceae bacterium]
MTEFLSPAQYFSRVESMPRKSLGQNFLAQPATAARIVQSAELRREEVAVEIGPGLGALTRFILPAAGKVHLIELDRDMAGYLRERVPDTVEIHERDALSFDFTSLGIAENRKLVLLGNLPYNISSPLLFHIIDSHRSIERAVFMVQKEVGMRFAANPGTKDYGVLSVLLGMYSKVRALFTVGPGQFYPPPKVESLVLRIDFAKEPPEDPPFAFLRQFVSKAFQQRRKTLANSIKGFGGISSGILAEALEETAIEGRRRPETLSSAEFLRLAETIRCKIRPLC